MALVRYGSLVTELSGKLGGHVFQRSAGGSVVHTLSRPPKWPTPRKLAQQSNFLRIKNLWNTLTPADVANWNAASIDYPQQDPFGNTFYLTAYALFIMLNLNLLEGSFAPITTPLPPEASQVLTGISGILDLGAGTFMVDCNAVPVPATMAYLIYAGYQAHGLSSSDRHNNYKFVLSIPPTNAMPSDIATQYGLLYPGYLSYKSGESIYCKIVAVHSATGQRDLTYTFISSIVP